MAQTNPEYKQVTDVIDQNGGNIQQAVYSVARQKGVDPNEALNQARQFVK